MRFLSSYFGANPSGNTVNEIEIETEAEVGGISNIPGLSSSEEEKLLEYSSVYQSEDSDSHQITSTMAPFNEPEVSESAADQLTISESYFKLKSERRARDTVIEAKLTLLQNTTK